MLTDGRSIQDFGKDGSQALDQTALSAPDVTSSALSTYNYDFFAETLSEIATRGIFEWLRSTGYPRSEKPIYQHSWIDLEDTDDEEEPDDAESDVEKHTSPNKSHIETWLNGIE